MIGEVVGNFRVIRQLGAGGMGEVWLAEHKDIATKVAVKLLLPHISADHAQVQRFFNEAVAVSKIKHAGIAKIFDVGFHASGRAYLVMEFLDGEPLAKRIQRTGQVPLPQLADIARQIASVLEATHREGITHRDLKPDNIFIVPDAEQASGERVKVLDFGIAKLGGSAQALTGAGAMGTPAYMSPEQWRASASVDGRADLYSLGCLVFEMAAGRPPFPADSIAESCQFHLNARPQPLRSINPMLPPPIEAIVAALLAKAPEQRPGVVDVKNVFATFAPGVGNSTGASATTLGSAAVSMQALAPPARRRWLWPVVGGVVVLAGVATAGIVASHGGDAADHAAPNPAPAVAAPAPAPAPAPPPAAAPPAPAPVEEPKPATAPVNAHVRVATTPADAEVRLDGAVIENHEGHFPRDGMSHRLEVIAHGYKTDARMITLDGDRDLQVALQKDKDGAPIATRTPAKTDKPKSPPAVTAPATPTPTPTSGSAAKQPADTPKSGYKGTQPTIITTYPGK